MKKVVLLLALVLLTLASCESQRDPEELFNEQKSGVVLVLNKFYYRMRLPNGELLYFTGLDEEGNLRNLTGDETDARQKAQTSFGTAFFIDKKGTLLTNRHVASPPIDRRQVRESFSQFIDALMAYGRAHLAELKERYDTLEAQKGEGGYFYDEQGEVQFIEPDNSEIDVQQQLLERQYNEALATMQQLQAINNPSQLFIEPVCRLGIAYDGTYVNNEAGFLDQNPCFVTRTAGSEEVDLALLQLESGKTPDKAFVFDTSGGKSGDAGFFQGLLAKKHSPDELKVTSKLYMMGYNAGIVVATTKKGIKAQLTMGTVSQQPDGERVLYSIPTVEGSSGSPVIDEWGNLVAVNFAKLAVGHAENFNFGIPLKQIQQFLQQR